MILILALVLIVTLRGDTKDTQVYKFVFEDTTTFPSNPVEFYASYSMEWMYGILSWLIRSTVNEFRAVLFLYSVATFFLLFLGARASSLRLVEILPFYLGTFFIAQQLMQIRQGVAVAFAFYVAILYLTRKIGPIRLALASCFTLTLHTASVIPLLAAFGVRLIPHKWNVRFVLIAILGGTIALAVALSSTGTLQAFDRLAQYSEDPDYGAARSYLDLAFIRAVVLTMLFTWAYKRSASTSTPLYFGLLTFFVASLAIRIGFIDTQILSGRLSSTLGFAEIFLLALVVRGLFASPMQRLIVGWAFFITHAYMTLAVQLPFVLTDYFSAL